jgi:hypothetical protein
MLTLILWWAGILLEGLILFRAFRNRLYSKYPLFSAYIACVLAVDVSIFIVYRLSPSAYEKSYWGLQFLTLIVGYGVVLEILRQTLAPYAGAERCARIVVIGIFAAVFSFVLFQSLANPDWSPAATNAELERDLRTVQAFLLAGILGVAFYYGIAIGRNLKGMILGYGLFIGTSVINLALRSYAGPAFESVWKIAQPLSYLASLLIWTVSMWSYHPNPMPESRPRLDADYEFLALRTREALGSMRSYLGKAARP